MSEKLRPSVLIVEDDEDIRDLLESSLDCSELFHHVQAIASAEEALEFLQRDYAHIILLDLNLPGIGGGQLLELLNQSQRLSHYKVLVISGELNPSSVAQIVKTGIYDFLPKPFTQVELLEKLKEITQLIEEETETENNSVNQGELVRHA